jgi:hypothetical protein
LNGVLVLSKDYGWRITTAGIVREPKVHKNGHKPILYRTKLQALYALEKMLLREKARIYHRRRQATTDRNREIFTQLLASLHEEVGLVMKQIKEEKAALTTGRTK